jgi:thiol:disulfide interchange protein DsbD
MNYLKKIFTKNILINLVLTLTLVIIFIPAQTRNMGQHNNSTSLQSTQEQIKPQLPTHIPHKQTPAPTHSSFLLLFLFAFSTGLLISLTPCIYPMIPITAGILQTQATGSLVYNFIASFLYVLGIATVYSTLGYIAATTKIMFGSWIASPWLIVLLVLLFLYLAGSLFGFYELYIPAFFQSRTVTSTNKSLITSFLLGLVAGTIASPCLTPALATVLALAAKQSSALVGFFTLFFFSLGMGSVLIAVGTFTTVLNTLPQAGLWMLEIKKAFGFIMLGMCVYASQHYQPLFITPYLYASVGIGAMGFFFIHARTHIINIFLGVMGLLSALYFLFF